MLFIALAVAAGFSLFIGCRGAASSSKDFQWGASYLVLHHADPYAEALSGYRHHLPHFSPPNYLPEFYLLLLPLAALSFHTAAITWCVLTLLLSVASMALLENIFRLQRIHSVALLLLLWCSAPFRTQLQVGQMSMLELFLFCLVFYSAQRTAGLALGLSFAKYSFSPVALSWLLFRKRSRMVLFSLAVPLLGLIVAWILVGGHLLNLCLEPVRVSRVSVWPGLADLMTLTEYGLQRTGFTASVAGAASYAVALAGTLAFSFALRRKSMSAGAQFVLVAVASLLLFKHLIYDYVFLLVPFCYAASAKGRSLLKPITACIGFFWFAIALVPRLRYQAAPTMLEWCSFVLACAALAALLLCLMRHVPRIEDSLLRESTEDANHSVLTTNATQDPPPPTASSPSSLAAPGISRWPSLSPARSLRTTPHCPAPSSPNPPTASSRPSSPTSFPCVESTAPRPPEALP